MNVNCRFELCIFDIKVRRRVVIEIHPDDKAIKEANGRHDSLDTMKRSLKRSNWFGVLLAVGSVLAFV